MGKVLFTKCKLPSEKEKMCALLLAENRLLAAQVMPDFSNRIGAVYIAKVKNVVKNIDACFVEIGEHEVCFLSMREVVSPILLNRAYDGRLLAGDELLVQISQEAQKTKQAAVTTRISISNQYAAISVGSPKIGYSNKIDKSRKEEIKKWLIQASIQSETKNELIQTQNFASLGLIIRTKADDCTQDCLLQHIQCLLQSFQNIIETARHRICFSCIMQAPPDFEAVLDQLAYSYEYDEILTDDKSLYEKLYAYQIESLPDKQIRLYEDQSFSLSKLYSLEQKLDIAFNNRVWLKSGGYLIIEPTEALTVIDVNTGKYDAKKTSCDTYEKINMEAAQEIALQLRLRNLSGIIVVDFINMDSAAKEEALLDLLRKLVRKDKIQTHVVDITPLGLVEITRKKRNKPLREQFYFSEA